MPDGELANIIQYIKTFSPKWQKEKPGAPIVPPPDPWNGQEQAAIQRGKELYHVTTQCAGCHPNYATKDDIASMTMRLKKFQVTSFRDDMYGSILKESEYRTTLQPVDEPPATEHAKHEDEGRRGRQTRRGAKPRTTKALAKPAKERRRAGEVLRRQHPPPRLHALAAALGRRSSTDLYRTIAAGVGGTAMPSWKATARVHRSQHRRDTGTARRTSGRSPTTSSRSSS